MRAKKTPFMIWNILMLLCISTSFNCHAKKPEEVDVFLDSRIGPVTYGGSGFLIGAFSADEPSDDLLLPLKPQRVRGREEYLETIYRRCQRLGISMEVIASEKNTWESLSLDGKDDYKEVIQHFESLVERMLDRGLKGMHYCVFLDADSPWINWVEETEPYFLEAYKQAYQAIKRTDPEAKIVGPSSHWGEITWWWKEHKDDHTWFLRRFIDYSVKNECVPDMISWHDYSCNGLGITRDAKDIREHLRKKGLPDLPLVQDDLGCKEAQFKPGTFVSYLANIERAQVRYTNKCCWDRDCRGETLNGLLTKRSRQPRSLWWMYKAYGDLTGKIVEVIAGSSVDGVVAIDTKPATIRCVFGRHTDNSDPVLIRFHGLGGRVRSAKVTAQRIQNSEDQALEKPKTTISRTVAINRRGELEVEIDDMGPYDAYSMTITFP